MDQVCYNGSMSVSSLPIIGSTALVEIAGLAGIPAKIDTGADTSCLWASAITMAPDNSLEFCLFSPISPLYTGEKLRTREFSVQRVRSSTGEVTIRYRVRLSMKAAGKRIRASFTLSDRATNNFPVLIGRKTLKNRFLVDVSKVDAERPPKMDNSDLEAALAADPQQFHQDLYQLYQEAKNH